MARADVYVGSTQSGETVRLVVSGKRIGETTFGSLAGRFAAVAAAGRVDVLDRATGATVSSVVRPRVGDFDIQSDGTLALSRLPRKAQCARRLRLAGLSDTGAPLASFPRTVPLGRIAFDGAHVAFAERTARGPARVEVLPVAP